MADTHGSCSCQNVLRLAALLTVVVIAHAPYSVTDRRTMRPPYPCVLPEHMCGV
jgi:hypothetical protein